MKKNYTYTSNHINTLQPIRIEHTRSISNHPLTSYVFIAIQASQVKHTIASYFPHRYYNVNYESQIFYSQQAIVTS